DGGVGACQRHQGLTGPVRLGAPRPARGGAAPLSRLRQQAPRDVQPRGIPAMKRAIIQAGGRGTRLYPYTTVLPKPLMPIGHHPILAIVLRQLVHHGFLDVTITVGPLGHLIMAVFGDGSRFGARIRYVREEEPRGTMGGLSQLGGIDEPVLVMNGDLLTDFNFRSFMR